MAKEKIETKNVKEYKDPLEMILNGEKLTHVIDTRRGKFEIAFPLPSDLRKIETLLSDRLGGRPIESFTAQAIANMKAYATLDIMVVDSPAWWKNLKSSEECPDDNLIHTLYGRCLRYYSRMQKSLTQGTSGGSLGKNKFDDEDASLGDGAFSGIANE